MDVSTFWLDNLIYTKLSDFPVPHAQAIAHTRTEFFDTDPVGSTFFAVIREPGDAAVGNRAADFPRRASGRSEMVRAAVTVSGI